MFSNEGRIKRGFYKLVPVMQIGLIIAQLFSEVNLQIKCIKYL